MTTRHANVRVPGGGSAPAWGAHRGDPAHANESWRMNEVFARAREFNQEA
jgi:hypothetical protein